MFIEHASRMLGESARDFYRDIKEEKVIIDVNHDSREASWKQYDKGAASKMIKRRCLWQAGCL